MPYGWAPSLEPMSLSFTRTIYIRSLCLATALGVSPKLRPLCEAIIPICCSTPATALPGTFLNDEFDGEPIILAMNRIGFQAGAVGNHEFDYGIDVLRTRVKEANFPILTANLETGYRRKSRSTQSSQQRACVSESSALPLKRCLKPRTRTMFER